MRKARTFVFTSSEREGNLEILRPGKNSERGEQRRRAEDPSFVRSHFPYDGGRVVAKQKRERAACVREKVALAPLSSGESQEGGYYEILFCDGGRGAYLSVSPPPV